MTKTQLLDARRNIRKELVAFLSIVVIGMLAVVAYLSIAYSAYTLEKDANRFFEDNGLFDLEITSTLLMDEADLETHGCGETGDQGYMSKRGRQPDGCLGHERAGERLAARAAGRASAGNDRGVRH